ncbi:phosphotransferase [Actinoplanes sp. NPDC089786]|uniref:protein kinase domain-containing protein n=1 Tax=Actinoplanes sp. NPDC089786 TaxID=3155185 RepID=UPI0034495855
MTRVADRYRLVDQLGVGRSSMVWRAYDDVLGREVAVKVLSPEVAQRARLLDRIRAAGRLRDRFVAEVYDVGETEAGLPFVVMELVPGRSLGSLLAEGELSHPTAVTVGAQVAAALAAAHARRGAH